MEKKPISEKALETRRLNAEKARMTRLMKAEQQKQIINKYRDKFEQDEPN